MYQSPKPRPQGPYQRRRACVDPALDAALETIAGSILSRWKRVVAAMEMTDPELARALDAAAERLCTERETTPGALNLLGIARDVLLGAVWLPPEERRRTGELVERAFLTGEVGPDTFGVEIVGEVVTRLLGEEGAPAINEEA